MKPGKFLIQDEMSTEVMIMYRNKAIAYLKCPNFLLTGTEKLIVIPKAKK
jgi:hypothetical protein